MLRHGPYSRNSQYFTKLEASLNDLKHLINHSVMKQEKISRKDSNSPELHHEEVRCRLSSANPLSSSLVSESMKIKLHKLLHAGVKLYLLS